VPDPKTSLDPQTGQNDRTGPGSEHERLREELQEAEEEILRLRDLLIGKDAELGLAKGQLTELEERIGRYTRIADRLRVRRILSAAGRRLNASLNKNG
jgi:hypothetical protein